jgi:hypothetical protein
VVKFDVNLIMVVNLSFRTGKNYFVVDPFVCDMLSQATCFDPPWGASPGL